MIIYGLKNKSKVLGLGHRKCKNCKKEQIFVLGRNRTWFTLYFIPIFPVHWKHLVVCRTCGERYCIKDTKAMKEQMLKRTAEIKPIDLSKIEMKEVAA